MTTINLHSPSSVSSSSVLLFGTWVVRHSNRAIWRGRRNGQLEGTWDYRSSGKPSTSLQFSFQEQGSPEVITFESTEWKVLGRGRDGKLESWMHETEAGIGDSSGEVRADWRPEWLVLYFPDTAAAPAGIDVLCNREEKISDATMQEIRDALAKLDRQVDQLWRSAIIELSRDGARDGELKEEERKEREKRENRTGAEQGISPYLTYDDEEKSTTGSKCILQ